MSRLGIFRPGAREVILGMNGTGKTQLAERLTQDAARCVFFSTEPDYYKPGRTFCTVAFLEHYRGILDDPHARIVIALESADDDSWGIFQELRRLVRLLREATARRDSPGGFVFVLDEVGEYSEYAEALLRSLFRKCRHDNLAVILVSQLATDIPYRCRKLATRVSCFGQEHKGELDELRRVYPDEFVDAVSQWTPGHGPAEWRSRTYAGRWSDA